MKYDDGSWHYEGDFPKTLAQAAGSTHIAMFAVWAASRGLLSAERVEEAADLTAQFEARTITPTRWFLALFDEKLTDDDLGEEGNRFARSYYADEQGIHTEEASYIIDYCGVFPDFASLYAVPDSWASFDAVSPVISRRFEAWRTTIP